MLVYSSSLPFNVVFFRSVIPAPVIVAAGGPKAEGVRHAHVAAGGVTARQLGARAGGVAAAAAAAESCNAIIAIAIRTIAAAGISTAAMIGVIMEIWTTCTAY